VKVKVAHPLLLRSYCGLKKTDRIDAKKLAVMLKAGFIPEAHIPNKKVRMERDLVRQHIHIVQSRTAEICRARALLLRHRIKPRTKNIFGKRANWLEKACIPDNVRFLLQQSARQIRSLEERKKEVDTKITKKAKTNKDAAILQSIPGVGWFTAYLAVVTLDDVKRFPSAEQLVSYAGLAPRIYQSGDTRYTGRISKQGRPELRWALIQCAWIAVRKSKRFRKTYMKIKRRSGNKKAIVAVARKLLTTMYYLLKKQEAYNENA
jgi:transposase